MAEITTPEPNSGESHRKTEFTDGLENTGLSPRQPIWRHPEQPDLLLRDEMTAIADSSRAESIRDQHEKLTEAVFRLEDYGIAFPGIGSARHVERVAGSSVSIEDRYTTTQKVEGKNLRSQMSEVPQHIVIQTVDAMLRYYEDMLRDDSGREYLTDLCLSQMVYGKAPGDSVSSTYFVDLEVGELSSKQDLATFHNAHNRINQDIARMEELYKQDFDSFRQRLAAIAGRLLANGS